MRKWTKKALAALIVALLTLSLAACGGNTDDSDYELPYWDGFDFGPNLSYAEEYKIPGDPGEYMNAAEAAKLTFDSVKSNGNIPGYSDNEEYTMTLIDLSDINDEECYVYRCDGDDYSAGFAFAYQSGGIYMQGQGGQWVLPDIGDPSEEETAKFEDRSGSAGSVSQPSDWDGSDLEPNLAYAEEYELQGDPGEYKSAGEAAKLAFDAAKLGGHISGYNGSMSYIMTLIDLADINGEECYVYRCDGGDYAAGFAYAYQSGGLYMQGYGGQWVPLDAGSIDPADVNWWGEYNSINYVLGITNYNGTSFYFTIDDEEGVAALDPDDPYSAQYGEMVFSFDGIDTINITGGDYAETFFRSQY